ncbi:MULTISPECIES: ATP-binding cassette domain-containing protein [unclassified Sphingomonas]|jgi:ABC-type bacteriocin/lantibiotic exporter with double-glycine peptidase domain|uniref:ATP-binding cassette domain-containing protein n=1 Tax=unclassified Sphingomonas TaxID=196159 RepID=UPI0008353C80|nr:MULTISPECIES: ABC transporter ATP-binding protein [unclassified Sphingomonas]
MSAPNLLAGALHYSRRDRALLLFTHTLSAVASVFKIAFPLLVGQLMNEIQQNGVSRFDELLPALWRLLALLAILWVVRIPLKMLQFRIARRAQNAMIADLNERLFSAPLAWHDRQHSGDIASRVQQSSSALFQFTTAKYASVEFVIQIIGPTIALALISPVIMLGSIISFVIVGVISFSGDRYQTPFWVRETEATRTLTTGLVDGYRNVMTLYAARRRGAFTSFIDKRLQEVFAVAGKNVAISEWKGSVIEVVSTAFNLGLVVLYVYLETRDRPDAMREISLGNIYMVQAYVMTGIAAMLDLVANVSQIMRQRADFMAAAPIYAAQREAECDAQLPDDWSRLEIKDMTLTYAGIDEQTRALRSVSLSIARGRRYALVGANGSGKSTLLKLLSGLLHPDSGRLEVDGNAIDFGALRHAATLIPQHPELLEGTLEHNLSMGAPAGSLAQDIARSDVVRSLLSGIDVTMTSHIQEAGTNWSGGQRQRIALARGLLSAKGSSLVLADEPTSSIDPAEERSIIAALLVELAGAVVIVSVHNLELVEMFDDVIVLDGGVVVDAGPVAEVCVRSGYFDMAAPATAAAS